MIKIKDEDRDAMRFLWISEIQNDKSEICEFRSTRLSFGLKSSPAMLSSVISLHIEKVEQAFPDTVNKISRSILVGDVTTGFETCEEAKQFFSESRQIFSKAGMNLRKWATNSTDL